MVVTEERGCKTLVEPRQYHVLHGIGSEEKTSLQGLAPALLCHHHGEIRPPPPWRLSRIGLQQLDHRCRTDDADVTIEG